MHAKETQQKGSHEDEITNEYGQCDTVKPKPGTCPANGFRNGNGHLQQETMFKLWRECK